MDTLHIAIWEVGKGEEILSNVDRELTMKFMQQIEKDAERIGHHYCFWVLDNDVPFPIVGTTSDLHKLVMFVTAVCERKGVGGYQPFCTDEVYSAMQAREVEQAQRECPSTKELH